MSRKVTEQKAPSPESKPTLKITFRGGVFPDGGAFFLRAMAVAEGRQTTLTCEDLKSTIAFWRAFPHYWATEGADLIARTDPPISGRVALMFLHSDAERAIGATCEAAGLNSAYFLFSSKFCRWMCKHLPGFAANCGEWPPAKRLDPAELDQPNWKEHEEERTGLSAAEHILSRLVLRVPAAGPQRAAEENANVESTEAKMPRRYVPSKEKGELILAALKHHHGYQYDGTTEFPSINIDARPLRLAEIVDRASTLKVSITAQDASRWLADIYKGGYKAYETDHRLDRLSLRLWELSGDRPPVQVDLADSRKLEAKAAGRGDRHRGRFDPGAKAHPGSEWDEGVRDA